MVVKVTTRPAATIFALHTWPVPIPPDRPASQPLPSCSMSTIRLAMTAINKGQVMGKASEVPASNACQVSMSVPPEAAPMSDIPATERMRIEATNPICRRFILAISLIMSRSLITALLV